MVGAFAMSTTTLKAKQPVLQVTAKTQSLHQCICALCPIALVTEAPLKIWRVSLTTQKHLCLELLPPDLDWKSTVSWFAAYTKLFTPPAAKPTHTKDRTQATKNVWASSNVFSMSSSMRANLHTVCLKTSIAKSMSFVACLHLYIQKHEHVRRFVGVQWKSPCLKNTKQRIT